MGSVMAFVLLRPLLPGTEKLADMGIRVAITVGVAFLAQRALFLAVKRMEAVLVRAGQGRPEAAPRGRTVGQILRSGATLVVGGAAVLHILAVLGWDIRPLLAGAGIVGIAVGLGAQTLLRDLIAGVFILVENQLVVGELVEIGGKAATVEDITLRSTRLRDFNGYVHFVPNGEMRVVVNRSRGWNRVAVDVAVAADQDLEGALRVCRGVVSGMNGEPAWRDRLLDPVEVWGVESLGGHEALVRIVVRARPGPDGPEAARELRRRLHQGLGEAGIRPAARVIPPPPGSASRVPPPAAER